MIGVEISYSQPLSNFAIEDEKGRITRTVCPTMEALFSTGERLRIIKDKTQERDSQFIDEINVIFSFIGVQEQAMLNQAEKSDFKDIFVMNGSMKITCREPREACRALEVALQLSQNFAEVKDQWFGKACEFINNSERAGVQITGPKSWDDQQEARIRQVFSNQIGAITLLEELKELPYTSDVKTILNRLEKGRYSEAKDDFGFNLKGDLERRGFDALANRVHKR